MPRAPRRPARHTLVLAAVLAIHLTFTAAEPSAARDPAEISPSPSPIDVDPAWAWPVGPPVRLLAPFRAPATPYSAGHRGIDLAAAPGGMVRAPADGVVSFAGPVAGRPVLSIAHGNGIVSSIEPVAASVAADDAVREGEVVGVVGVGGHCDGACVHVGVRVHGEYVSPLLFLGGVPRAVLLPLGG
ncbi:peptidoglycan DD-metalloendopeptidase family protein [Agromyces aurantiacus]|uniref:Peptidoglycan DD-metalloendopeptidase family protein n=1 Tax=Agromyces aurantiacus TaxID=165814 RepID=A0ABV9R9Z7_9MICO|nr:M23 family metallopeptidase [Agromyces aurantiacus]MBM7505035.1 murein DD-endopeptidase MepM/ murein hydrolase activator NlpD [Agromyces aurantiacus]